MKVTILGSNGFLSTALAKFFIDKGWRLDVYGRRMPCNHEFDNFYELDFMSSEIECSRLLDSDMIVYAIGAGVQSDKDDASDSIYSLNVSVPVTICNKLKNLCYKGNLITFGSYFEIGETNEARSFTEEDILKSTASAPNDYVVSKRMLSTFASSYSHDFKHWHFILPTIYGAGENPMRLIPYTINAIKNGERLHYTFGDQTRQYIHVSEIPVIIDRAFHTGLSSGVYNVEGMETMTVKDIVLEIHHTLNKNMPKNCFGYNERQDTKMKYLALDGRLLQKAICFEPIVRIHDIVESYL